MTHENRDRHNLIADFILPGRADESFSIPSCSRTFTMATLTVSTKQAPFPFAQTAIATFTGKADINFDDTATGISLDIGGSTIDDEEAIVQALAKEAGLADDSAKVPVVITCNGLALNLNKSERRILRTGQKSENSCRFSRNRICLGFTR